ncbi:glycosyltransferase family 4 protein [Kroppenstedtia pulmonis]|uniref:Glycosyltransferase family 4 protein n=1 Tax=Kroppenstedtia pulmonis TaxID=1380685 RepID=A0A7D4BHA1_9BACL|nr:glycosyltransferase family 4 protein [Kroppenstedtia pulmonis]QKG85692.1 glycosyltransferase family 4 protein [Kroppenstedtia pulmonis]
MSIKVLVVSHMYPNPSNPMAGIFVHNQVKSMKAEGVECCVISPVPYLPGYPNWKSYRKFPHRVEMDGIPIRYIPTWMFPGGLFFFTYGYLYFKALVRAVAEVRQEFDFDIIHCHTIFPDGYAGTKLKQVFSVPVVTTVHGSDIRLYPYKSKGVYQRTEKALRLTDHIITVSEELKRGTRKIVPGAEVSTIYNGFDPQRFYPRSQGESRQRLNRSRTAKELLFVGNLYPVKGLNHLLDAFTRVASEFDEVQLYLVGDGPLRSELMTQARKNGIRDRVHFTGRRPHDEIPWWINSCDVVVLSSHSEGMPSILLEAMGCGKPVVATDVGGISEILRHGRTGFLVKPKDADGMARYLSILLMENEGLAFDMGERAFIESGSITWQRSAEQVKSLYVNILQGAES